MVSVIVSPARDRAVQLAAGHLHFYGGFRHSFIAEHDDRYTQCHIDNAYDRHLPAVEVALPDKTGQ